jgi:hypothetical protein
MITPMEDIRTTPVTSPTQPTPVSKNSRPGLHLSPVTLVIIFIILLAIAALILMMRGETVSRDVDGNVVHTALPGELVSGFPDALPLEAGAKINESYAVDYEHEGTRLPYVNYTSNKSYADNIIEYHEILKNDGWVVLQDADVNVHPTTNIYARKESTDVNVTFTEKEGGIVEIQLAYSEQTRPVALPPQTPPKSEPTPAQ